MATTIPTPNDAVQTEDLLPVRSRVSWGAVFAGAIVALAVYFLLSVLGAAIGLSVSDRVQGDTMSTGAAIWAILVTLVSLFIGGWVVSQCAVGETKMEAAVYGVILWGVLFAMLLWLLATGISIGFSTMLGVASTSQDVVGRLSDNDLRALGLTREEARTRIQNAPAEVRALAQNPNTTAAAWWTFGGILLSMIAAVGGALAGAGPLLQLRAFGMRSTTVRTVPVR
jgi:hypothetical protein